MAHPRRPARLRFSVEHWAAFWTHPHPDLAAGVVTPDVVARWPGDAEPVRGVGQFRRRVARLLECAPGLRLAVAEHADNGEVLFIRWTARLAGRPTGLSGVDQIQLRYGRIKNLRIYCDPALAAALLNPVGPTFPSREQETIMTNEKIDARAVVQAWVAAEAGGDAATIDGLLGEEFTGVGPLGFILTRSDWLDRHASGALRYSTLRLDELQVREHGDHAVVVARQTGEGAYHGHPLPEALRATVVLRRQPEGWRVAHVHTSFVAGTPGAPPIPGRPSTS